MALQRSWAKNKESIMRAFGLTRAERATLNSGNDAEVKKMLTGAQPVCFIVGLARTTSKSE
jgi:hypothetical protein